MKLRASFATYLWMFATILSSQSSIAAPDITFNLPEATGRDGDWTEKDLISIRRILNNAISSSKISKGNAIRSIEVVFEEQDRVQVDNNGVMNPTYSYKLEFKAVSGNLETAYQRTYSSVVAGASAYGVFSGSGAAGIAITGSPGKKKVLEDISHKLSSLPLDKKEPKAPPITDVGYGWKCDSEHICRKGLKCQDEQYL